MNKLITLITYTSICISTAIVVNILLSPLSYASEEVIFHNTVDIQPKITLNLTSDGDRILNIDSFAGATPASSEEVLTQNGHYLVWRQTNQNPSVLMQVHTPSPSKGSSIQQTPFSKVSEKALFSYGVQQKPLDIKLLAYIIEIYPDNNRDKLSVHFNQSCVLWSRNIGSATQALIQAGCTNLNFTVTNSATWNESIRAGYFGISKEQLHNLRGGHWSLKNSFLLQPSQGQNTSIAPLVTNHDSSRNPTAVNDYQNNLARYAFQFNAQNLTLNIPFTSSFWLANNHQRTANITLINSKNSRGDYIASPDLQLEYTTNQSIVGVKYSTLCDNQLTVHGIRYCAIENPKTKVKSPVEVFLSSCEDNTDALCGSFRKLYLGSEIDIRTTRETSYIKLHLMAPALGKKFPGHYSGMITVMANAQF
ncbi:hypothetical protein [Dongshaea marina]|uniref:hypothetical protein n=1 Tax=Dongshaea marina TaxID=2047966 RepID=UPI000D3E324B|nr:hypothetical protein [Dongshaea marina]